MANIKKAGVEFITTLDLRPDLTGKEDTFTVKYRRNSDGTETDVSSDVTELDSSAGTYQFPVTVSDAGDYTMLISSTIEGFDNIVSAFVVANASIDDVKAVVDTLTTTLEDVKGQVDTLDEDLVNGISEKVVSVDDKLTELKALLSDTDDDAITSLRELLQDITDAGSDRDGVIASLTQYTDNLELMLEGKEYTDTEGNTVAVDDSYGLSDLFTKITEGVDTAAAIESKVDDVKTVIDANKSTLEDAGFGLSALKTLIDNVQAAIDDKDTDNDDVLSVLNDEDTGIVALRDSLMTKLDSMDDKLDGIGASVSGQVFI